MTAAIAARAVTYDPDLYAGVAPFYSARAPYAPVALEHVRAAFALDGSQRLMDLGCGPGVLAIPFARHARELMAMDPDPEMLAEGRRRAAAAGVANIEWREGGSHELGPALGPFHLVLMGQSFHWMDRDEVLRRLFGMVEGGGGIALVNPGLRRPQEAWEDVVWPIVEAFLGQPRDHAQRNPEKRNEPAIRRSSFVLTDDLEFPGEIERDADSILRCVYSMSFARPALFGARRPEFEAEARAALARAEPSGRFPAKIETSIVIARKPG